MDYQLDVDDVTRPWALDYEIDKKYYQDVFYDNIRPGVNNDPCRHDQFWHWSCQTKRELYYFHMMCFEGTDMKNEVNKVSKDLKPALLLLGVTPKVKKAEIAQQLLDNLDNTPSTPGVTVKLY